MKLVFVIHSLGMGGAERVLSIMASHFVSIGYEVDICTIEGKTAFYDFDDRIKIHNLELAAQSGSLMSALFNNATRILKLRKAFIQLKPDIVISFLTDTNIISIIAAKSLLACIMVCEHNSYGYVKSRLWLALRRFVYPFADTLSVLTHEDVINYKWMKRLEVLPNPIVSFAAGNVIREHIVLGVGRLTYTKGFERLIEAFCLADTKDWRLVIVGDGDQRKNLELQALSSSKKEMIALVGAQKDVASFYRKSSIFVLSSRQEGFPMVLCEAMSFGVAPIAYNCKTGPSEIITDNLDGVLVEEGDINALSDAISQMIADQNKRNSISNAAGNIVNRLGVAKVGEKWETIFKAIKP